jgi:hypothetical protein
MELELERLIKAEIEEKIEYRSHTYFDLPQSMTLNQIKHIINFVSELTINDAQIKSRLYSPHTLQIYWDNNPKKSLMEFLNCFDPITDPEILLLYYNKLHN